MCAGLQTGAVNLPFPFEIGAIAERFLRADFGGGKSGVEIGASEGFFFLHALAEKDSEAADEGVAGAGGVEGVYFEGGNEFSAFGAGEKSTAFAEREDDALHSLAEEKIGALGGVFERMDRHAGDEFRFGLVGNEIVGAGELIEIDLLRGSGVDDAADAFGFGEADGVIDGAKRNFELHDDSVGFAKEWRGGVNVFRREEIVRAFHDDDAILAAWLDEDGSDAAGNAFGNANVAGVNSLGLKIFDRGRAEEVAAYFGNHSNRSAAEASGYGLVRAFAAKAEVEFFAKDSFAGTREDVVERGEVNVGAADNGDEGLFGHSGGLYLCPVLRGSTCLKGTLDLKAEDAEGTEKRGKAESREMRA